MINNHSNPMKTAADIDASCSVFPYELVREQAHIQNRRKIAIVTANGDNMQGITNVRISLMNDCDNPVNIAALVSIGLCIDSEGERDWSNSSDSVWIKILVASRIKIFCH